MRAAAQDLLGAVRPAAVAGVFYPGEPGKLRRAVRQYLDETRVSVPAPKAIIVPHAGYIYSGPVAASAYVTWMALGDTVRRVVLIGPSHYCSFDGLAASGDAAFATPLGLVPVDAKAVHDLCRALPQVSLMDEAHVEEHSLEVQLPFLQTVLAGFKIVPLLAGQTGCREIAEVIERLWGGSETRVVISSDLSHYYDYAAASLLDVATARAIEMLRPEDIGREQACGRLPICGLLRAAQMHQLRVRTLDLRNSGDTAGPRDKVVGYGAFAFEE